MMRAPLSLIAGLSIALGACSSASGGDSVLATCNALVVDTAAVPYTVIAAAAPTPAGGTIADGTYALTALNKYTGAGGSTSPVAGNARVLITITGNTMQQAGTMNNGPVMTYTTVIATSGTTLTLTDVCPGSATSTRQFTATAAELHAYETKGSSTLEQVYTMR
jgi:hypothetical protein